MNRVLLSLIFLLFAGLAEAATRYVDPVCPNSITIYNPTAPAGSRCGGGSSTVYTTIANGAAASNASDILNIRAGTYVMSFTTGMLAGKSSTDYSTALTIQSFPGESVIIQPSSGNSCIGLANTGATLRYIIFKNLICDGSSSNATGTDVSGAGVGGGANGGTMDHIKFDNIEIRNWSGNGYTLGADDSVGNFLWVTGGSVHDVGTSTVAGTDRHAFYTEGSDNIVEGVDCYNVTSGYCIHNYGPGPLPSRNTYRNLRIHNAGTNVSQRRAAMILTSGSNNLAYNNVLYGNQNGIQLGGTGQKVYNNTVYASGVGFSGAGCCYPAISIDSGSGHFIRNNLLVSNQINSIDTSGATVSNNITSTSPATYFVNAGASNFNLLPTATLAIDQGTANIAPGITIPACSGGITTNCYNGAAPDIGGLETGFPTAGGGPPLLTANPSTVATGAAMSVTVDDDDVNERIESAADWVGMFVPGAAATVFIDWFWMNGSKTSPSIAISDAVINFTAPSTPGTYEFRFYQNGSDFEVDRLATAPFTVIAPGIVMKFVVSAFKIGPSVTWKIGTP